MKALEQAKRENGHCEFNGEKFVLLDQAVAENYSDGIAYTAKAVKEQDWGNDDAPEYRIWWDLKDDFDYATDSDESNACDWSNPVQVDAV